MRCFVQLGGQRHIRVIMSLGWLGNVLVSGRARGGGWGKRLTTWTWICSKKMDGCHLGGVPEGCWPNLSSCELLRV